MTTDSIDRLTGSLNDRYRIERELVALSNHGERAPWTLACIAAEIGLGADAERWAREAVRRHDPTIYAYGRGRLTPVHALSALPVYDDLMQALNWPTAVYRHRT